MSRVTRRARVRTAVSALLAALALTCPIHPVASQGADPPVAVYLTTRDQAHLLAQQTPLSFAADTQEAPLAIEVDPSSVYQQMTGFGASFTDSSAWLVHNRLQPAERRQLMLKLFDRAQGIGLSVLRQPIGASDFALSRYSFDDMPAGQRDDALAHFSIDHDRAYILPLLWEALAINPSLRVLGTAWSAPGWMKTTGSMIGGSLRPDAEDAYAQYLVKFAQAYAGAGVPIARMTPGNEPLYTPSDYPGMWMDAAQQAHFVGAHLAPALAAAGLVMPIDVWDHNWDNEEYVGAVFADPSASARAAGVAWHCYAGDPAAMTRVRQRFRDKEALVTECSGGYWTGKFQDSFARDMEGLIIGATRNWASTVIKWNIALDAQHGPHVGGCTTCTGLVTIDPDAGTVVSFNFDYYSLGHISKFVLPGARRIGTSTAGAGGIHHVAFQNLDGSVVLIVFNPDPNALRTFEVRQGGRSFSYTLPPQAAATFTWDGTALPSTPAASANLALNRPAAASSREGPTYAASNAVDGDPSTRWSSAFSEPEWLQVDMGNRYALSSVVLSWEQAHAVAYDLQVSDDAIAWSTVYSTTRGQGGTETVDFGVPATGRYFRLYCKQRAIVFGQLWGFSLWEVRAFGTAAPTPAPPGSTPYLGTAVRLPGVVEAENFDRGGEGLAYSDLSPQNSGGAYRPGEAVDIEPNDTGYDVGWIDAGEWLLYHVNVAEAGSYRVRLRVSSPMASGTGQLALRVGGAITPVAVPSTGAWSAYREVTVGGLALAAGPQVLRVDALHSGWNLDRLVFEREEDTPASRPYLGTAASLPGIVQAENFDEGGPGGAYTDRTAANEGGAYRPGEEVDIEATTDTGGGFNVGWMAAGEWLAYTVNVSQAGAYTVQVRVAANGAGGTFHLEADGSGASGPLVIPDTGGWQNWTTVETTVTLQPGVQVLRLVLDTNGPGEVFGNVNWFSFVPAAVTGAAR